MQQSSFSEKSGIVYILTNAGMPNQIKIGRTKNLTERLKQLYTTGIAHAFDVHYAQMVEDAHEVEKKMHGIFDPNRTTPNREFFNIDPEHAKLALTLAPGVDVTDCGQQAAIDAVESQSEREELASNRRKRAASKFSNIGLTPGTVIHYLHDSNHAAVIDSDDRVLYKNESYSLSALTKHLRRHLNQTGGINGWLFWTYQGRILADMVADVTTS